MVSGLRRRAWSLLAARSDSRLVCLLRNAAERAVELLHIENHDFRTNGEMRIVSCLDLDATSIIDVGANCGAWALAAHRLRPEARLYCFEIAQETRRRLRQNLAGTPQIEVLDHGLADRAGTEHLKYYPRRDVVSSVYDYPHPQDHVWLEERVQTGDAFLAERNIGTVDLLKVDTEGADLRVLQGFEAALARGAIRAVQFEYGFACVLARALLIDFYQLLEGHGYVLGKVHACRVDFRPYQLRHENFFGPNFIAVHGSCTGLIARLSGETLHGANGAGRSATAPSSPG
jgi:FkbM family methyltransferase